MKKLIKRKKIETIGNSYYTIHNFDNFMIKSKKFGIFNLGKIKGKLNRKELYKER